MRLIIVQLFCLSIVFSPLLADDNSKDSVGSFIIKTDINAAVYHDSYYIGRTNRVIRRDLKYGTTDY